MKPRRNLIVAHNTNIVPGMEEAQSHDYLNWWARSQPTLIMFAGGAKVGVELEEVNPHLRGGRVEKTSISPSSAVELNTTSALANYATEADLIPARVVLYFLSFTGFLVSFMMRTDINIAMVAMVKLPPPADLGNSSVGSPMYCYNPSNTTDFVDGDNVTIQSATHLPVEPTYADLLEQAWLEVEPTVSPEEEGLSTIEELADWVEQALQTPVTE
uniref:Uncharacterized protein n=1 Tax=Timema cristinae TaxID=61476 RepID=A0A7R9D1A3_TIMCR|nr:unnamed protein product [Timema cristinae]